MADLVFIASPPPAELVARAPSWTGVRPLASDLAVDAAASVGYVVFQLPKPERTR